MLLIVLQARGEREVERMSGISSARRGDTRIANLIGPHTREELSAGAHRSVQVEVHVDGLSVVIAVTRPSFHTADLRIQLSVQVSLGLAALENIIRARASAIRRVVDLPVTVIVHPVATLRNGWRRVVSLITARRHRDAVASDVVAVPFIRERDKEFRRSGGHGAAEVRGDPKPVADHLIAIVRPLTDDLVLQETELGFQSSMRSEASFLRVVRPSLARNHGTFRVDGDAGTCDEVARRQHRSPDVVAEGNAFRRDELRPREHTRDERTLLADLHRGQRLLRAWLRNGA